MRPFRSSRCHRKGHAIVELSLLAPWLFFLFVGAFDFGFYAYSLISVQNAARLAVLKSASDNWYYTTLLSNDPAKAADQTFIRQEACSGVRDELLRMPNYSILPAACDAAPLDVDLDPFLDSEGKPALRVTVAYQTVPLVPIPGLLPGKLMMTRVAEARVYGD